MDTDATTAKCMIEIMISKENDVQNENNIQQILRVTVYTMSNVWLDYLNKTVESFIFPFP